MKSNTSSTREVGATDIAALADAVRAAEGAMAQAVALAGRLAATGACERVEGLPLDWWLGLACRMTGADRATLVTAGEVLADMPEVAGMFARQELSWGQVRAVVRSAKPLSKADRAVLDARVSASADRHGGIDAYDPDQLVEAVEAAADDLRGARAVERRERRVVERSFVALQAGLDGGVAGYFELDPILGAAVVNALDAAAGSPAPDEGGPRRAALDSADRNAVDGDPSDGDSADGGPAAGDSADGDSADGDSANADSSGKDSGEAEAVEEEATPGWTGTARGRQYAEGLGRICADWLGGSSGRPARPLLVAHVDLADLAGSAAGTVELNVRGGLPRLTARTAEALATDADVRAVIFDGSRPLAASRKLNAAEIPTDTRLAVRARDKGCRFPGCRAPIGHCDVHHTTRRSRGGDHHPDRLAAVCRPHHQGSIHRQGWQLDIHPETGEATVQRGRRRWRSLPRGTPLARPNEPVT